MPSEPVDTLRWVPVEDVEANDYNPNAVARIEMGLLLKSIEHDGFTQPIVTVIRHELRMTLPCGHVHKLTEEDATWGDWKQVYDLAPLRLPTRLESSTEKAASTPTKGEAISESRSRSARQRPTEESSSVGGFNDPGATPDPSSSDQPEGDGATPTSTSGTSADSTRSAICLSYACPTCSSKESKPSKPLQLFTSTLRGTAGEIGLQVSCSTSATTEGCPQEQSPPNSGDLSVQSGASDPALGSWLIEPDFTLVIVDGFHRYWLARENAALRERLDGMVPVVMIDKDINGRMAATVRHNRARGKHSIDGMANMVFQMLENGMSDVDVCNELGLEAEELLKLKHVTGFSYLYADHSYNRAWITKSQIKVASEHGVSLAE